MRKLRASREVRITGRSNVSVLETPLSVLLLRERIALALLAMGTIAFMPGALDRFVFIKVAMMAAGIALAFSVPSRGRLPARIVMVLLVGAIVLVISTSLENAPLTALVGRAPRFEGVFTLTVYLGAAVAGARLLGPQRAAGSMAWFLQCLALASFLVGVEAIFELAGLRPLASNVARPGSLLGNASDEGAWAVLALGPLAAVAARTKRWPYVVGTLSALLILVASGSRGALIGGVVVAIVIVALEDRRSIRMLMLISVLLLVAGSFINPATRSRIVGSSPYSSETVKGRELIWIETIGLVTHHPVIGVGLSDYVDAIPRYHDLKWQLEVGPTYPPDSPHDWILQAASDGGLLLAADAAALAATVLQGGLSARRRQRTVGERAAVLGLLAGVSGYGVALLFHFTSPGTTPLAATMAGALVAIPGLPASKRGLDPAANTPIRKMLFHNRHWVVQYIQISICSAIAILLFLAAVSEIPLRAAIDDAASGHLGLANANFQFAADLRPWDSSVSATAGHAFAVLASLAEPGAARIGSRWSGRALKGDPDSVTVLEDAATIDIANNRTLTAVMLLKRAEWLDPTDPTILYNEGEAQLLLGRQVAGLRELQAASHFAPSDKNITNALRHARSQSSSGLQP